MEGKILKDESSDFIQKFRFVNQLPGYFFVKDLRSEIVAISPEMAILSGWKNPHQGIGKTDFDILCPASEYATQFIFTDQQALIHKEKTRTLQIQQYQNGWTSFIVEKNILSKQNQEIIGIFSQMVDVSKSHLFKYSILLSSLDQKFSNTYQTPSIYFLDSYASPLLCLSKRQQECVFLMIRGKTLKEISPILGITQRTVESYVEQIKHKLGCYTKGQIIEKALDAGFLYYIPERFLKES